MESLQDLEVPGLPYDSYEYQPSARCAYSWRPREVRPSPAPRLASIPPDRSPAKTAGFIEVEIIAQACLQISFRRGGWKLAGKTLRTLWSQIESIDCVTLTKTKMSFLLQMTKPWPSVLCFPQYSTLRPRHGHRTIKRSRLVLKPQPWLQLRPQPPSTTPTCAGAAATAKSSLRGASACSACTGSYFATKLLVVSEAVRGHLGKH